MPAVTKSHVLAIGLAVLVIAAALAAGLSALNQQSKPGPSPTPTPSLTPIAVATPAAEPEPATIQGKKIYPSEAIPGDFRVCAVNTTTQQETCTAAGSEPTYSLQVPAGSYRVFALVPSLDPNFRAYYSRFVECGLSVECTDHTPITVTAPASQTLSGIDVGDFYK
jgi:hypothetical protein